MLCRVLTAALLLSGFSARGQDGTPPGGTPILTRDALLTTPVGGLERTKATTSVVTTVGQPFAKVLRVTVRAEAPESNATQLTLRNTAPVVRGDALLASFYVRGAAAGGKGPAQVMFLFERADDPWTKSATHSAFTAKDGRTWKRVLVPFVAAESYRPGEAMVSLRFAFGPQTVEVGGLSVVSYGRSRTVADLVALSANRTPLGAARVTVRLSDTKQTLMGFGGNFAQPRYGATEPLDAVGRYNLRKLRVVHARIGIPLNHWTPERGVYRDEGPAHAALLQMQEMARQKIPIAGSVWEGPAWMLGGRPEQAGRTLPPEKYTDCIEAVAQFLVTARDKYGATVDFFSFNEPDYGVNFKFTPSEMAAFIRQAGPRFAALDLKTKFLTADTANGANFPAYARPLLEDRAIAPYLGPLAFHCWDALSVPDARYAEIAAMGRKYGRPVWCTEAGHDAGLWQQPDPWESWENALRTALAYEKTLRLTGAALMDYWTYQDNYPLVSRDGTRPYRVFHVLRQMEEALPPGAKVAAAFSDHDDLRVLATVGPGKGRFSVLLINPVGAGAVTLAGLPRGAAVAIVRSAADRYRAAIAGRVCRDGRLTVGLPARSVVTVMARTSSTAAPPKHTWRAGPVRVRGHALTDRDGPFLGLGVSYFTALWRCRHDRARLESDMAFLSRQGFNYYRMLSMVGWYPAWEGKEIAPVAFTGRDGRRVEAWPDYWERLRELIDLAYDRYGLRAQITIFADGQLMPEKADRIAHMRKLLTDVLPGREHKVILLEVANEAWQNGFPGAQGVADLREFTRFLAERTAVPVATTSNHEGEFAAVYADSAADIATWHFSRDRGPDDGWKPVYDCWDYGDRPGFPPASSNEPIGPGASVAAETDVVKLVMAAAFAYAAKLPMYVFHCEAGVFGRTHFEDTPAIDSFRPLMALLPPDLPDWRRNDGKEPDAPFTVFAGGQPDRYAPEAASSRDGCVRNTGSRKGDRFICVPIGIRPGGLTLRARVPVRFQVHHPLTGRVLRTVTLRAGERVTLPPGPGALLLIGRVLR